MPTLQRFQMFSQSPQQLAAQMLGRQTVAPRAPSRAYEVQFSRPAHAQGVIAPAQSWYLGNGNGLGGLGALSGDSLVQGVDFTHVWSMEDLTGSTPRAQNWMSETSGGPRGAEYPPQDFGFRFIPAGVLQAARTAWAELNAAAGEGNLTAINTVRDEGAALQSAAREVDATWDGVRFGIASRAPNLETRRHTALKAIARSLNTIIDRGAVVRDAMQKQRDAAAAAAAAGANVTVPGRSSAASSSAATASASNPYVLPGVIFGGLALVGGFIYWKRKSK